MKKLLLSASMLVLLAGCQNVKSTDAANTKTFYVDSSLADCMGVAPMKCMKVKENPNDDWQLFYSSIDGFEYQPGATYVLKVKTFDVPNPPADAPSIRYELVKVIDKK